MKTAKAVDWVLRIPPLAGARDGMLILQKPLKPSPNFLACGVLVPAAVQTFLRLELCHAMWQNVRSWYSRSPSCCLGDYGLPSDSQRMKRFVSRWERPRPGVSHASAIGGMQLTNNAATYVHCARYAVPANVLVCRVSKRSLTAPLQKRA